MGNADLQSQLLYTVPQLLVPLVLALVPYPGRTGIIARATLKEGLRQPLFWLLLAIAAFWLLLNSILPMFTFGEDVKIFKDTALPTILIVGLMLSIYTASMSITGEIEGKTAMTLLSKPVTRQQFVVGKYLGILQTSLLVMIPLCLVFLTIVYFKVGYDAREHSQPDPTSTERLLVALQVVPGLLLIFFEVAVLTAISVAISTRLPMVLNVVTCVAIFVVGHLTPVLVEAGFLRIEFVAFMARLIATLLPALEVFNISASVATGAMIPASYLLVTAVYSAAYVAAVMLLAFILFEDRDLA